MKKSLLLIIAVAGLLAGAGLEARRGSGGHRGGRYHGGWRRGGRYRGGWGLGSGIGFGISLGGPSYYDTAPVIDYIDDPYGWYFGRYPNANWDSYGTWLRSNSGRFRRPWSYYHGPRYRRRWGARPGIGFGIGIGL